LKTINNKPAEKSINQPTVQEDEDNTVTSDMNKVFRLKELQLIKKNLDPDLDSLDNRMDSPGQPQPNNIILNDMASTASSIMTNTTDIQQCTVPKQLNNSPENTIGSISTVSSLKSITSSTHLITKDKLKSLFEVGMTQKERRERADQYTLQQLRKVMIEKNKI
jgi:hypothetical protein